MTTIIAPLGMLPLPRVANGEPVLARDVRPLEEACQHLLLVRRVPHPATLSRVTVDPSGTTVYRRIARHDIEQDLLVWVLVVGDPDAPADLFEMSLTVGTESKSWVQGYDAALIDLIITAAAGGGVEDIEIVVDTDAEGPELLAWGVVSLPVVPPYAQGYVTP